MKGAIGVEKDLEKVLALQEAGVKLYTDLAEFFWWLGEERIANILREKAQETLGDSIVMRFDFIAGHGYAAGKKPAMSGASKPGKVTQLQWQEGTVEPEDEPNVSNGVDVIPKDPTRQPWEQPALVGLSGSNAPGDAEELDKLYYAGLGCWLAYEQAAADLYRELYDTVGQRHYKALMLQAEEEVRRLKDGLEENNNGVYSCG
jgi:hypothetical protein